MNTDVSEVGNWTIRGTATNLKHSIRLTSEVPGTTGSICQRVPTLFKEWSVEIELLAWGEKHNPGHGIWFYFTEEVCPDITLNFTGITFWINTTSTDKEGLSDVYFAKGNGTLLSLGSLKPVGRVNARTEEKPLRVQISRRNGRFTVETTKNVLYNRIVDEDVSATPDYGYFTLSAATTSHIDNNDIRSFRAFSLSPINHPKADFDFSEYNRKFIENNKMSRRPKKRIRRQEMELMSKYLKELNMTMKKLQGTNDEYMRDSIGIISEAYSRALRGISVKFLENFITNGIDDVVNQALQTIENAAEKYQDTLTSIDDLWLALKNQLLELAVDEKKELARIQNEIFSFARKQNLTQMHPDKIKRNLKEAASQVGDNEITHIFLIISMLEITAYVIFFIYKKNQTNNFKKHD